MRFVCFIIVLELIFASAKVHGQDSLPLYRHTIGSGGSYCSTEYFNGFGLNASYSLHFNKNSLSFLILTVDGSKISNSNKERKLSEFAFSYRRNFPINKLSFATGAGISYNLHTLNINDRFSALDDEPIRLKNWGIPVYASLSYPATRQIRSTLEVHGNLNNVNNLFAVSLNISWSF